MGMTPNHEYLIIKKITRLKPFVKASALERILHDINMTIECRKIPKQDLEMQHMLFVSQAWTCNKIMKEM